MSKTIRRGLVRRIGGADFPCPNVKLAVTFLSSSGSGVCRHIIRPPSHPFFICRDSQSVRVKVLVIQSCPTLFDPLTIYSPPDSSVHGILQARIWSGCHFLLQGIFPTQGSNSGFLHCRQILYCLGHQGSPVKPWPMCDSLRKQIKRRKTILNPSISLSFSYSHTHTHTQTQQTQKIICFKNCRV